MNLIFTLMIIPVLISATLAFFGAQRKIAKINTEQIEDCHVLDCEVGYTGSINCKKKDIGGGDISPTEKLALNTTASEKHSG